MYNERHIEDYKGQKFMVYGSGSKWYWRVTIFDNTLKSQLKTSNFSSSKIYLTEEEAIVNARKFVDRKVNKRGK